MNIYQNFYTSQQGVHEKLISLVRRYHHSNFHKPFPKAQIDAVEEIKRFVKKVNKPIVLDSGCGTGLSTTRLAEMFPNHAVIGIDRSLARISRAVHTSSQNYLIVWGDLIDLWRLLAKEGLPISHHFMFYPNPYPKKNQLKRRFYAHPIFNTMISLSKNFELRTNWDIYAHECMQAFNTLGYQPGLTLKTSPDYISLFEKKYLKSSCKIYVIKLTTNKD